MAVPFGSRTLGHLVKAIDDSYTHATIGTLFLMAGVDAWAPDTYSNKQDRVQRLLAGLRNDGTQASTDGAMELLRQVLVHGKLTFTGSPTPWWPPLKTAAAADGWDFDATSDSFVPVVAGTQMSTEIDWISRDLQRRGWPTPLGHYEQAVSSFASGQWAAANGQLRTFYESLMRTAAGAASGSSAGHVQASVSALDAAGHLLQHEAGFANHLWRMLHAHGSHPGLSDEDESRFRLLAVTGYARFLLSRLP